MFIQKVFADAADGVNTSVTSPITQFTNLGDVFGWMINLVIGVGWAMVFVMLALGFVQYVMSRGEKTAVESAQKWLTYAVIGGVGLFFVTFVRNLIPQLLGGEQIDPGGSVTANFGDVVEEIVVE